jgi:ribosomal protein S18 acetylase RimI-like enzyme
MVNTNSIIKEVSELNSFLIKEFLDNAGESLISFRYYNVRSIEIIKNHLTTAVIIDEGKVVGYGHLDNENGIVWLGVAICETEIGNGFGKLMMKFLVNRADELNIELIRLTVDKNNSKAIKLYLDFGFLYIKDINLNVQMMERKLIAK